MNLKVYILTEKEETNPKINKNSQRKLTNLLWELRSYNKVLKRLKKTTQIKLLMHMSCLNQWKGRKELSLLTQQVDLKEYTLNYFWKKTRS